MPDTIRLIVVEESANEAEVIFRSLRKARYSLIPQRHVEDDEDLLIALNEQEWDLIISVPQVGDFTIARISERLSKSKQNIPIIVLVDELDGKSMGELFNAGATQVISAEDDDCLRIIVERELQNLEERRRYQQFEQLYQESQKHNKMLLDSSRDAIAYVQDGIHIYANPSYLKMFDYENLDELMPIMDLVVNNDQEKFNDFLRDFMTNKRLEESQIELDGVKSDDKRFRLEMIVSQASYDSEPCLQVIIHDQSWKQREPVTGLFNSQHFLELLAEAIAEAKEARSVLFYIALDNFAKIKESAGVGGYDPLIKNVGSVIDSLLEVGALARFSDSVFTLLIPDKDGKKYVEAGDFADKICKAVEACVTELGNQSLVVTCSIGITQVLASAGSPQNVLTDARAACKEAQEKGGNRFNVYKFLVPPPGVGPGSSNIAKLIETAVEENRLSLRYQPIVGLHGETKEMYEIFLRMVDSEGQVVPSHELFQEAEKHKLSLQLDKWVIHQAFKVLVKQIKNGHQSHFFVKLSAQSLQTKEVLSHIGKLLKSSKLPGKHLIFEFRESVATNQINAAKAFINQLKKFQCQTALEHFGMGLNFETALMHLPVNYVKIDASYSKDLLNSEDQQNAVQDIIKMAQKFGQQTIAVAVEDANSLAILWEHSVDFAQGNYIQEVLETPDFDFSDEG